ncbi:iron export ABC transporter permease subunit FetB [Pelagicoccus sp. SDUM812003]|uniref:ABC transporter permease n=1 Tax=Pelagicoccus sp. SDUM812003 TaxID=3041267 RepID=UPI00280C3F05|nr:iron export ABC transporter permease subunit FetB [Pelagicoccus sp. SDUM812003]MDQ8202272.1 iron export ABC transporter permease subunit FetB [Pelagicoccus sp. SDUM812003]
MASIDLSYGDLALAALILVSLAALFYAMRLGLSRSLLIAGGRMMVQLALIGYVLRYLFESGQWWMVAAMALVMLTVASREILARQKRRLSGWRSWRLGASTLFVSSFAISLFGLAVVVRPEPWYTPQYAIPILGMIISNTMNAISLGMDRLTDSIFTNRNVIEQRLALGQAPSEAIGGYARDCIRSGMTPVINSMSTAGIVSLPGMMTGQILAGASPVEAVEYQIVIWLMIAGGCGFGMTVAIKLLKGQLFDERDRLRLDRLR